MNRIWKYVYLKSTEEPILTWVSAHERWWQGSIQRDRWEWHCVFACLRARDIHRDEHAFGQQTHGSLKHTTITESLKHSLTSRYFCVCTVMLFYVLFVHFNERWI